MFLKNTYTKNAVQAAKCTPGDVNAEQQGHVFN